MTYPLRQFSIVLLLLALCARIAVPPGLMLETHPDGVRVVLCTTAGVVDAKLDLGKSSKPGDKNADMPCMGATPLAAGFDMPQLPQAPAAEMDAVLATLSLQPGRGLAAPPPPATGPPALAYIA